MRRPASSAIAPAAAALLAAAGCIVWVLGAPDPAYLLEDDAYYYLTIARRLGETGALTFDGRHSTTGFHPLWLGFAVVADWLGGDPDGAVLALLLLESALVAGTAGLLAAAITPTRGWQAGVVAALWPAAAPVTAGLLLIGMESSLVIFLIAATWALVRSKDGTTWTARSSVGLGLLCALLFLARPETGIAIPLLLLLGAAPVERRLLWRFLLPPATAVSAYLLHNWWLEGLLLPVSGAAKSMMTQFWSADRRLGLLLGWPWVGQRALIPLIGGDGPAYWSKFAALGLGGLVALGVVRWRRPAAWSAFHLSFVALLALGVHFGNALLSGGGWLWPAAPTILATGLVLSAVTSTLGSRLRLLAVGLVLACLLVARNPALQRPWARDTMMRLLIDGGRSLSSGAPAGRGGAWNAGAVAYFSGKEVINLDGLVNDRTFLQRVLREGRWDDYLTEERIRWIADLSHCPTGDPLALRSPWFASNEAVTTSILARLRLARSERVELASGRCVAFGLWEVR